MKVLHTDRNSYKGGESTSVNLTELWKTFRPDHQVPKQYGSDKNWIIDLVPKFVLSSGKMMKIFLKTNISKYLEWKCKYLNAIPIINKIFRNLHLFKLGIEGTYVYQSKKSGFFSSSDFKIEKVPTNEKDVVNCDLMGFMEKRRCKNFFTYVSNYDPKDANTQKGHIMNIYNLNNMTMGQLLNKFELEPNTIDFIGHAIALHSNDQYLNMPAIETIDKIKIYMDSSIRYGYSPFIYPLYGSTEINDASLRIITIQGGVFKPNTDIDKILYNEEGMVYGVQFGEQVTKCKVVVCDPTYAIRTGNQTLVKKIGQIIRTIFILNKPIPGTKGISSLQIIIPQKQVNRKSDIHIVMVSNSHLICSNGYYVAIVSTIVETNNPRTELQPAINLIGKENIKEVFESISDQYVPASDGVKHQVFISNSLDPSSDFESEAETILRIYKKISGEDIDLENLREAVD